MLAGMQRSALWGQPSLTPLSLRRQHPSHRHSRLCASCWAAHQQPAPGLRLRGPSTPLQQGVVPHAIQQHAAPASRRRPAPSPPTLQSPQPPRRSRRCMHGCQVRASKDGKSSSSKEEQQPSGRKSPPTRQGRPFGWLQRLVTSLRLQGPVRLVLNVMMLFFLMRLWPMGGRTGLGDNENMVIQVPFSQFVRHVKHDDVQTVSIDGLHIGFALKSGSVQLQNPPAGSENTQVAFSTVRPADYSVPYDQLERNGVSFSAVDKRGNGLMQIMVYVLYAGLLLSALNRLPIKLPQKGAGRKHKGNDAHNPVMFDDVAGVDEAKEELQEIVEFLRSPDKFSKLGARPPSGVLLVGPPGTGKTLLARAVAGEANCPFFSISASEFVELYVGMGAMRVRELFANARKEAPAIVFIDEIDAVAKGRDMRLRSVGNDEREQTLNQLLTELDGFDTDKESVVICIAATNRPDVLDAALLRPGRFDRRVSVERPDRLGREQILRVHLERRGLPLAEDVSVEGVASMTMGFTGADLANLVNEAALLAGRRSKALVGREEFEAAILRAVAGIEKKRSILRGIEKDVVAKHEVGHALVSTAVARLIPGSSEVEKLSIIPRSGGALGFTYIPPKTEDRALMFDCEIRGQLAMLMGGRAAETLTCSAVSTGAVDDIRRATDLAYKAVSEFGLSASVGPMNVGVLAAGGSEEGSWFGKGDGDVAKLVEQEVKEQLEAALTCAAHVVTCNKALHEGLSALLTKEERVEGEVLLQWLEHVQVPESLRQFVLQGKLPAEKMLRHSDAQLLSNAAAPLSLLDPEQAAAIAGLPDPSAVLAGLRANEGRAS